MVFSKELICQESRLALFESDDFVVNIRLIPQKTVNLQGKIYVHMRSVLKYLCLLVGLLAVLPLTPVAEKSGWSAAQAQQNQPVQIDELLSAVQGTSDTLQISLLTCTPGTEVYELYGHSALRVKHLARGTDWVFNYGIFDFSTPNFIWRFMLGQTDYTVAASPYDYFCAAYQYEGRAVSEQVLNLTPAEEARMFATVYQHAQQKGWSYRYNFLYDNCVTRLIKMIEESVDGQIEWPKAEEGKRTFRDMLHESSQEQSPWSCFGQDLILGQEVDEPLSVHLQMFSPIYAERFVCEAVIRGADGQTRPLVKEPSPTIASIPAASEISGGGISPTLVVSLLAIVLLLISVWEMKRRKVIMALDNVILSVRGVLGILVALLFFASEHPAVGSNWLILFLNPLPLLILIWKICGNRAEKHQRLLKFMVAEPVLVGIVLLLSPQTISVAIYVFLASLALRGVLEYKTLRGNKTT